MAPLLVTQNCNPSRFSFCYPSGFGLTTRDEHHEPDRTQKDPEDRPRIADHIILHSPYVDDHLGLLQQLGSELDVAPHDRREHALQVRSGCLRGDAGVEAGDSELVEAAELSLPGSG